MSDTANEAQHRRPHPQPMAAAYLEFDLVAEVDRLERELQPGADRNAKTLVKYSDFRVVLTMLRKGGRIPPHRTKGRIAVHTIRGHVRLHADGRTFDLPLGTLLALDRELPHDVEALEDSALLLTISWPETEPSED